MDATAVYRSWAAAVKASGGVVTVFPAGPSQGQPAARYTRAQIAELQRQGRLGPPGLWSNSGEHGYYLPTAGVVQAARTLTRATSSEVRAASPSLLRSWFGDFTVDFAGAVKRTALIAGGAYVALKVAPPLFREWLATRRQARGR